MTRDLEVLTRALAWLDQGKPTGLAVVVSTWGSAPRRAGSLLAVAEDTEFTGSVSGGCVEAAVVERASQMAGEESVDRLTFGVSNERAWEVGLACGGSVEVGVVSLMPGRPAAQALGRIKGLCDAGHAPVLAVHLSRPVLEVVAPSPGDGPSTMRQEANRALREDRAVLLDTSDGPILLRPFNPPVRIVLIGAVHVAQALAPMIRLAGFEAIVVDPRSAWLSEARFPDVRRVAAWPGEALEALAPDHRTAVITLSHDPKLDDPALTTALTTEAFYVGALGSRRTHAKRRARLGEAGVSDVALDRVHAPVGLDLGAREPAEIAVAVLAEVLQSLRRVPDPA